MSRIGALLLVTLALGGCVDSVRGFTVSTEGDSTGPAIPDLSLLLAEVPDGTPWADVPSELREPIEAHAERTLDAYRAEWGEAGLRDKEVAVLVTNAEIKTNIEQYVAARFGRPGFVLADVDAELAPALRRLYLAHIGGARLQLQWEGVLTLDWDGVNAFSGPTLPDPETLAAEQAYAGAVLADLGALLAGGTLSADDAALAEEASFVARSLRDGSYTMTGIGADELESAGAMGLWGAEPALDAALLDVFPTDEDYLRAQNAMLLGAAPRDLSAHTLAVLTGFTGTFLTPLSAWAADPDTGRAADLLWGWYLERLAALPSAGDGCAPYSTAERERHVDAFLADLHLPGDPATWLAEFDGSLGAEGAALTSAYQQAAIDGVDALFDDAALPPAARAAVHAAILAESAFGNVVAVTEEALTEQTGTPDAAAAFQAALDGVEVLGGSEGIDPAEEARVGEVWADVRASLVARYGGPSRVVDIDANLPQTVAVDGGVGVVTGPTGDITVGLGLARPLPVLYVILTHEALHALGFRAGLNPIGIAGEGAASLTEHEAAWEVLAAGAPAGELPFWLLTAVSSDARRYGITDATIAVLGTDCAGGVDSAELAVAAAAAWGASGDTLLEAPIRAHFGTQFLSYLGGQFAYRAVVAYFEDAIAPGVDNDLDPFDLATCGLVNPRLTAAEVDAVEACLGL